MNKTGFGKVIALFMAVCILTGMLGLPTTAYAEADGDAAIVTADKAALSIGFAEGDSADGVTGNLTLTLTGASGSSLVWSSDNTDVIMSDGTVKRPAADAQDTEVTLTAAITHGEAEDTKVFKVTVLKEQPAPAMSDADMVAADKAALAIGFAEGDSADGVTGNLTLSLTGASGSAIAWNSDNADVIANDGTVTRPAADAQDTEVTLTATITHGEAEDTKVFKVTVLKAQEDGEPQMLFGPMSTVEWEGDGDAGNPYQVSSAAHLADIPNQGLDKHYIQTAEDIDLEGINWTPIGDATNPFKGTYNGNSKTISNLTINDGTLEYVGLFGFLGEGGRLEDITLTGVSVTSTKVAEFDGRRMSYIGYANVGGLVGAIDRGTVNDCSSTGSVAAGTASKVGGLVGYNAIQNTPMGGTITNCSSLGTVTGGDDANVGGLVGYSFNLAGKGFGSISNCQSSATVTGGKAVFANVDFRMAVGGLVGDNRGKIIGSHSTGNVDGGDGAYVGGLVGNNVGNEQTEINNSYSSGNVSGGNSAYVGGLIGYSYEKVNNCYSTGHAAGGNSASVGGLIGYNNGSLTDSHSTGNATGGANAVIGGMIGHQGNNLLVNCYSTGVATGGTGATTGGLYGSHGDSYPSLDSIAIDTPAAKLTYKVGDSLDISGLVVKGTYSDSSGGFTNSAVLPVTTAHITGFNSNASVTDQVLTITFGGKTTTYTVDITPIEWEGDGSEGNPYKVASSAHLYDVRNKMGAGVYFRQENSIDLSGYTNWTPIGNYANPFYGTYDGNGKTISNLKINNSTLFLVGLFGYVGSGGTLVNVTLVNVNVSSSTNGYTGGLTGDNDGNIIGCSSGGSVTGNGTVGGLAGCNYSGTISDSSSSGNVTGGNNASAGGLVGDNGGTVTGSHSTAAVTAGSGEYVHAGGLIGYNYGSIAGSYSSGNVTGGDCKAVGGLVGYHNGSISNCYSTGDVSGSLFYVGGLIGYTESGSVANCYSTGSVTSSGGSSPTRGGLIAGGSPTVTNSYYLDTAATASAGGTPLTAEQLKQLSNFEGWDFEAVWKIGRGVSSPTLSWQPWTPDERITADCAALDWDDINGDNTAPDNITNDLAIPATGDQGSTIAWSAVPAGYINTSTGAVTRPTDADKTVTLTATVSYAGGTAEQTKTFELTIKYLPSGGGGGTPTYRQRTLTNSSTGVMVSGNSIHSGAQLTVKTINAQSLPAQIREAIAGGELIAGYDITLSGGFMGELTLSFPVGVAYNGQVFTILHYVNGRVETYTAVVANGKATVTVSSLSPFAVLSTGVTVPDDVVTDPPKTGDAATPLGFVMLGLAALCTGYLVMKRRKT